MRTLHAGFADHLATGATTLATCWRIERRDGVVLGFTDHDEPVALGGVQYLPAHGLEGGEATAKLGPQVDTGEVTGVLHSAAITEQDIELGRYAGAEVQTWRVNWRDPSLHQLLRVETIGEIVREDGFFRAELRSRQQALNMPKGRVYQFLCEARLGDGRCGVDLESPSLKGEGVVVAIKDRHRIAVDGLGAFTEGWLAFGHVRWLAGKRVGLEDQILRHTILGGEVVLGFNAAVGDWAGEGDTFLAYAGCDRSFAACRSKFNNAVNFRGFPHIPGSDFILRYPGAGEVLDGRPLWQ